jgi:hypothetical protein
LKKVILYLVIATLYLLTPVCVLGLLGTAVSKKYEVDEGYWHIDADKKLTEEQRKFQREQLDNKGNKLDNRITLFIIAGLTSFALATTLLLRKKTLMTAKKSGT